MRKLISIFVILLFVSIAIHSKSKDEKIIVECYNIDGKEIKEIPLEDALFIYEKIKGLKKEKSVKIANELREYLERKGIISFPEYNIFSYIYGNARVLINVLLRHLITQIIPQLFIVSASIMPHIFMGFSIYLSIYGEIGSIGLLGSWEQEGNILGLLINFIGIKMCIPFYPKPYVIFGICIGILSIILPY